MADDDKVRKLEGLLDDLKDEKEKIESEIHIQERWLEKDKQLISDIRNPDAGPVAINNDFMRMPDDPSPEAIKREKQMIRRIKEHSKKRQREIDKLVKKKDRLNRDIAGTMDAIRRAKRR